MNAHALLTSQGWRGTGHSLHSSSDSIGLSRPLLVSKKSNTLGVGKKQHKTSDMWWMNAFDKSLQGLDTSKEGQVTQTITNGGLDMVAKGGGKYVGTGGLYSCFVRGEGLNGTLTPLKVEDKKEVEVEVVLDKKRKRGEAEESKEERRARKAAKRAFKAKRYLLKPKTVKKKYITISPESSCESSSSSSSSSDEDTTRAHKEEKKQRKAGKATKKEAKRISQESSEDAGPNGEAKSMSSKSLETKEERKARRKLEKLSASKESRETSSSNKDEKRKNRRKD